MVRLCIKQHVSNIWSSIHEKVKQHWAWIEQNQKQSQRCSVKKVFLEISQNLLENTCARVSF